MKDEGHLWCPKCCTSRSDDVEGQPCRSNGCDGVIAIDPPYSTKVDVLPEPMTCGRRYENAPQGEDRWEQFKSNGDRVCSYCGSLHPDDWFNKVRLAGGTSPDAPYLQSVNVSRSDKNYKYYVRQPDVRNAGEGGIKFYAHHLPRDAEDRLALPEGAQDEANQAFSRSRARFDTYMTTIVPGGEVPQNEPPSEVKSE